MERVVDGLTTTGSGTYDGQDAGFSYYNSNNLALQDSYTYVTPYPSVANIDGTGATDTIYPIHTDTKYTTPTSVVSAADTATTPTTTCAYVYYPNSVQPTSVTTTLPAVSDLQNGSQSEGAGTMTFAFYDLEGNLTWSMGGDGYIGLNQYDATTGLLMETVENVNTASLPLAISNAMDSLTPLPTNPLTNEAIATPSSDTTNLNATTDYSYDNFDRVAQTLGPAHSIEIGGTPTSVRTATWTVYEDPIHRTITAQGYQTLNSAGSVMGVYLVNPVSVEITDAEGNVLDDIQATIVPSGSSVAWGLTTSDVLVTLSTTSPLAQLASLGDVTADRLAYTAWTSYQYCQSSDAQLASTCVYYAIPANGTGTQSNGSNESQANYDETQYGYDTDGAAEWTETPQGTITFNQLDIEDNVLSTWIGTNDGSASSFASWLATNPGTTQGPSGTNMVEVSANVYDADDYVTQTTDYQYATAASNWYGTTPTARVTQNFYDWQRLPGGDQAGRGHEPLRGSRRRRAAAHHLLRHG